MVAAHRGCDRHPEVPRERLEDLLGEYGEFASHELTD